MNQRKKLLFVLPVVLFAFSLPISFESTVVPEWSIQVVDQQGNPVKEAWVRQHWQHYSLEDEGHLQGLRADDEGRVIFPRRTITATVLSRVIGPITNILHQGVHASIGVDSYIEAIEGNKEGMVYYDPSKPMPERVMVGKRRNES